MDLIKLLQFSHRMKKSHSISCVISRFKKLLLCTFFFAIIDFSANYKAVHAAYCTVSTHAVHLAISACFTIFSSYKCRGLRNKTNGVLTSFCTIIGSGWGVRMAHPLERHMLEDAFKMAANDSMFWAPRSAYGPDQGFLKRYSECLQTRNVKEWSG